MVVPLRRLTKVKKHHAQFKRFQSDQFKRLAPNWRASHGIDNRMRRKFRGNRPMPQIGYGNDKKTKFVLPNGFRKFLVHNQKELEALLMHNRSYCAEFAHSLSARSRKVLVQRAKELNIRVTNAGARLRTTEQA